MIGPLFLVLIVVALVLAILDLITTKSYTTMAVILICFALLLGRLP